MNPNIHSFVLAEIQVASQNIRDDQYSSPFNTFEIVIVDTYCEHQSMDQKLRGEKNKWRKILIIKVKSKYSVTYSISTILRQYSMSCWYLKWFLVWFAQQIYIFVRLFENCRKPILHSKQSCIVMLSKTEIENGFKQLNNCINTGTFGRQFQ